MEHTDIVIIGAGLLGCFLARALRQYDLSVTVLEKERDVCTGISKANTGIIYPGYDMAPGTLKARLTVSSCRNFPELCRALGVRYANRGSLMVGFGPEAEASIRNKWEKGQRNGVEGLELLSGEECRRREPLLAKGVRIGLFSPDTCVVNPWELGIAAYENARSNGAIFRLSSKVMAIHRIRNRRAGATAEMFPTEQYRAEATAEFYGTEQYRAETPAEHSGTEWPLKFIVETAETSFSCRCVINCAGLAAGDVHEMAAPPSVRIRPTGADYILLEDFPGMTPKMPPDVSTRIHSRMPLRHVIFHEPEQKRKGLTLVPTVDGNLMIGPTEREPFENPTATEAEGIRWLREKCREVVPDLPTEPILRTFGAVRPNPYEVLCENDRWIPSGRKLFDFNIKEEEGFFSLIGIKTPGLTCAAALGEYLTGHIVDFLGGASENPAYDPTRCPEIRVSEMTWEEREQWVQNHPDYGRILCSCRDISEGEVRDAIRRGAVTLDGVKRRTGIFMGRCQGSRCLSDVLLVMAEELGCSPDEIRKDTAGGIL